MITLSACIEMMFCEERSFVARVDRAADAGLKAIEFWGHSSKNLDAIVERVQARGMTVSSTVVEFSRLGDPTGHGTYVDSVKAGCAAAHRLGCTRVITCVGNDIEGMPRAEQAANTVAALKKGAPIAADEGIVLCLEPLNILVDHKGYFLWSSIEAFEMVAEVDSPGLKLLFDIYHQQISEGNLIANMTANIDKIGHLHVADVPGRHEPGSGEINYENVFNALIKAGYDGYAGLEYSPSTPTTPESLARTLLIRDRLGMK